VLSAATGDVLYSQGTDRVPDFYAYGSARDPEPGDKTFEVDGINLDAGTNAFVVRGSAGATVYDSKGKQIADIPGSASGEPAWATSGNRDAKDFADDLSKTQGAPGTVAMVGTGTSVPVAVDTVGCRATRSDKDVTFTPPALAGGEECVITPKGLIGGDSAALLAMGRPSSSSKDTGAHAVAYDLKTGEQLWQAAGVLIRALPPSGNAPGDAAGQPRILVARGSSFNAELVVNAVVPD